MSNQPRPDRLFRYFPHAASDFFAQKKLWFSAFEDFNDPFDALPRFDGMLKSQRQHLMKLEYAFLPPEAGGDWGTFKKAMEGVSSGHYPDAAEAVAAKMRELANACLRVVCLSENRDSPLMWAHYADSHRGFVVEFDPEHSFFADDEFGKVDYHGQRPEVEDRDQTEKELGRMLFIKSRDWSYESEWRFVKSVNTLRLGKRRDGREKHYLDLPPDLIEAVYFGHYTPTDKRDEILQSLQADEWRSVKKYVMCLAGAEYALKPVLWDEWQRRPRNFSKELDGLIRKRE